MGFLLHIPVVLSFMLLAAHFMRDGQTIVAIIVLLFPFLLLFGKKWAVRIVQLALVAGVVEWGRTMLLLQAMRVEHGLPWLRLVLIIGAVAVFTGYAALVFFSKSLKKKYGIDSFIG